LLGVVSGSGAGGDELACWVAAEVPALLVDHRVVSSADQCEVAFVGGSAVGSGLEVVDVAPVPGAVAAGELAVAVAELDDAS
jgi:hypothetical protein